MSALKPLIDAATPGPWHSSTDGDLYANTAPPPPDEPFDEAAWDRFLDAAEKLNYGDIEPRNSALIVALRNAAAELDALIDAAKRAGSGDTET